MAKHTATVEIRSLDGHSLPARFWPAAQTSAPVLIAVHGGAWRAGSPDRYDHLASYLSAAGISVLGISYRLVRDAPETKFPAQMADLDAAVRHVAANASALGVNANRVGLIGDSAGAHLAALHALGAWREPDLPAIRAMVGIYGVYDLIAQFEHDLVNRTSDQITQHLMGISALDDRRAYFEASPLSYVVRRPNAPAFLIGWGTDDDVVDWTRQSAPFLAALKRTGHVARALPVTGAPHFWIEEPLGETGSYAAFAAPRIRAFLVAHL
jgi:acetyl esterase/lipase